MKAFPIRLTILILAPILFAASAARSGEYDCPTHPSFKEISAETVDSAFQQLAPHPRLLLTPERMEQAKKRIADDPRWAAYADALQKLGDSLLKAPTVERKMTGRRLLSVSRTALGRIFTLTFLYRLTGDEKYGERAKAEAVAVSRFTDWNPSHFLDVAEMTAAVALAYDSLFELLSDEERTLLRGAILEKGIQQSKKAHWLKNQANWNQVCHAGMMFGALAIADEEPLLAREIVRRSVNGVTWSMASYEPDGNYTEGPGYWAYGTGFNILLLAGLQTALGTDFGRSDAAGFLKSIRYYENVFGVTGLAYNYPDSGGGKFFEPTVYWYAEKLNDPTVPWNENRLLRETSLDGFVKNRLAPMALLWGAKEKAAPDAAPIELGFVGIGNGLCPAVLFRTSWTDPAAAYLGAKAGTPRSPHGHMDAGSFVYENRGVRWAVELGPESYHRIESRGMDLWASAQNADRWKLFRYNNFSHNTLTVYPEPNDAPADERKHLIAGELQIAAGKSLFLETKIASPGECSAAAIDLSPVYAGELDRAVRRLTLAPDGTLTTVDELTAPKGNGVSVEWRMLTAASVEVLSKSEARLTLPDPSDKSGKKNLGLRLAAVTERPTEIVVVPADTDNDFDTKNKGINVVIVRLPLDAGTSATLTVTLKNEPPIGAVY